MKAYTGVGSREAPEEIILLMTKLSAKLEAQGWTLRSGAADGADTGFENGVNNEDEYILPQEKVKVLSRKEVKQ